MRDLVRAGAANLSTHASWVQARAPGMRARVTDRLTMADSGLATDSFSVVCSAQLTEEALGQCVREVVEWYGARPFSWWVSPGDRPRKLPEALRTAGLQAMEEEAAMACELDRLPAARDWPGDLEVRRVRTVEEVGEFAALLAGLSDPPDDLVAEFYRRAAPWLLEASCPLRLYLGKRAGRPVSTSEVTLAGGVAGLYNISTSAEERRKGIGTAMTVLPLLDAAAEGIRFGVLQAAAEGLGVYERVGFRVLGRIVEYKPSR